MKKAYITTLGCKVNQFESAAFKTEFEENNLSITTSIEDADIIVVNTCTVTNKAGAQSRQQIRKAARTNINAKIIVTGCHAQLAAKELKKLDIPFPERLCVVGSDRKENLVNHVLKTPDTTSDIVTKDIRDTTDICHLSVNRFSNRTRAYLRVQDGCNSFCSYCIVPYTRGRSRSLPMEEVLSQAKKYAEAGHREIVITGIHVGQYGNDLAESIDIATLLKTLCLATPEVRYRLSSIEPLEISQNLLTFMSEIGNLMPHLHIPLQSGDDEILKRMNRRYTREQFASIISNCRTILPDAAIGVDVLVGFPGESEDHFVNTLNLLEDSDCTYLHVFPYSKRPGTPAAVMKDQVSKQDKTRRVNMLRVLSDQKRSSFYRRHCNSFREVLIESERDKNGNLKGFTDNYIPLLIEGDDGLKDCIVKAKLDCLDGNSVKAHITSDL